MKKIRKLLIIVIIALFLIILGCYLIYKENTKEEKARISFSLEKLEDSNVCLNDDCKLPQNYYYLISYDTNIEELSKIIDNINHTTKKYYEKYKEEKICEEQKNNYKYNYMMDTRYSLYTTNEIVNISINRTEYNLCDGNQKKYPIETYVYSLEKQRILSQNEFIKQLNISTENTKKLVEENMKFKYNLADFNYNDISFKDNDNNRYFYDSEGNLYYFYYDYNILTYEQVLIKA